MSYFVYAIKSRIDKRIYVGFTENVQKRLNEHNSGKTKSNKRLSSLGFGFYNGM